MTGNPEARRDGILVEELGDELIICDLERDVVHGLNSAAAACWQALDGTKSILDVAKEVYPDTQPSVAVTLVLHALRELDEKHLLAVGIPHLNVTRRQVIGELRTRGVAMAAVLATVVTLATPPPRAHASHGTGNIPFPEPCTHSSECVSTHPCCCTDHVFPGFPATFCSTVVGCENATAQGTCARF